LRDVAEFLGEALEFGDQNAIVHISGLVHLQLGLLKRSIPAPEGSLVRAGCVRPTLLHLLYCRRLTQFLSELP
jgi:hypothetical protein